MLTNMLDLLNEARLKKHSIIQFNINNLEWIKYILTTCDEENKPVILGVSASAAKYMGGYKNVCSMVTNLIDYYNIKIPVSIHLDHGSSFEEVKKAIEAGFTSVMIDLSDKPLDENIKITKEIVEYAHLRNVLVEGEIGTIKEGINADLNDCIKYVNETKIDSFAPAIGNLHGKYTGEVNLNLDLLDQISKNIRIPLVLHGASGIDNDLLSQTIKLGISKININTDLQVAWADGLREKLNSDNEIYDPRKIINFGEENVKRVIKEKLMIVGK